MVSRSAPLYVTYLHDYYTNQRTTYANHLKLMEINPHPMLINVPLMQVYFSNQVSTYASLSFKCKYDFHLLNSI